ncbi:hypothetical protein D3C77_117900 [compost metagenome]
MAKTALHLQPHLGVLPGESRQHRRHGAGGKILRHPEAQGLAGLPHPLPRPGQQPQDAARQPQQLLPLGRGHHLAAGSVEQRATELLLEAAHLLADGGLGQVHPLAGTGETAGLDDGNKALQQVGIQQGSLHGGILHL